MEYDEHNQQALSLETRVALANITERLNEAYRAIADLRSHLDALALRMDEADHMTSEEYGQQVVQQIMASMPAFRNRPVSRVLSKPA